MAQQQNILQIQKLELQELNRILKDVQQRLNDLQGFSGRVEIDAELKARGLVVTEIPQQEEVALSEEGKIWFQPREGQAPEAQLQVTESTETDFGTIRRRLDVVQRAAQDGEDVGKASTFDFNSPLTALVDLDTDEVDVGVDPDALLDVIDWDAAAALIDHGLLDGLGDALDHPMLQRKHGFELNSDGSSQVTISYDASNRIVTLTPNGVDYKFWIDGVQFTKALGEQSIAHGTTTGLYFLFYNSSGVLTWSTSPWSIRDRAVTPVALVYWNNTLSDGICFYECHTADRVLEFHFNLHFSRGCQYISGYDLTGYTLATATDAAVTYAIGDGVIADEDIRFASAGVADGGPYIVFYRTGASGEWRWGSYSFPFPTGTEMQYNQFTGGAWQLTDVTPGGTIQYVNFYICATTAVTPQAAQAFIIPGQSVYTSLTAAQAESLQSLSLGTLPFEEVAPLYRVTLQSRNSYGGTHQVQITQITSLKNQTVTVAGGSVGVTDHGSLTGLGDDDHTQYVLNTGDTMTGDLALTTTTANNTDQLVLETIDNGSEGSGLLFRHDSASPAADDNLGHIRFAGRDSAAALQSYVRVTGRIKSTTAGALYAELEICPRVNNDITTSGVLITGTTPTTTSPIAYLYAKPVARAGRAGSASTGAVLTYRWKWTTTDFDDSGGKITLTTGTAGGSDEITVSEAGRYHFSTTISATVPASTTGFVYIMRYNSSNVLQSYHPAGRLVNNNASFALPFTFSSSQTIPMAAGDYLVVESSAPYADDVNWNIFSLERVN